jgi:hypothetical protein
LDSTATSKPNFINWADTSGVVATRFSPANNSLGTPILIKNLRMICFLKPGLLQSMISFFCFYSQTSKAGRLKPKVEGEYTNKTRYYYDLGQ